MASCSASPGDHPTRSGYGPITATENKRTLDPACGTGGSVRLLAACPDCLDADEAFVVGPRPVAVHPGVIRGR